MKSKYYIILIPVLIIAIIISAVIFKNIKEKPTYHPQENLSAPIEIPNTGIVALNELYDTDKPALVMFYADWCTYCRRYMPIFGELSKKHSDKYNFAVVNCDYPENRTWVNKANIIAFPTLKIVDKKYDVILSLDMSATQSDLVLEDELNQYLKLRNKMN